MFLKERYFKLNSKKIIYHFENNGKLSKDIINEELFTEKLINSLIRG